MNRFNNAYLAISRRPFFLMSTIVTLNMIYFGRKSIKNILNQCKEYFYPKPVIKNILTETEAYIENEKTKFLSYYDSNSNTNSENITNEFYNKDNFKQAIESDGNELENRWKRRLLMESTPRGNIYMYYNAYKLGFSYYSDVNSLPYTLLNAVAMKYCRIFKCNDFFIDQNVITDKNKESPLIKILHIEEKKKKVASGEETKSAHSMKDAPFVKLRKNESKTKEVSSKEKQDNKHLLTNKFINLGKIYNMNVLNKHVEKKNVNFSSPLLDNLSQEHNLQKTVMSYKEYKARL